MKITSIIILLSLCVCSMSVIAQVSNEIISSELPENAMELLERINQIDISEYSSFVSTEQFGENNSVDIFSSQESQMNINMISVAQYGNENSGIINQSGQGHVLGVLQDGDYNRADIVMQGNNIQSLVTQVGNSNLVEENVSNSYVETATRKMFSTEQYGDENIIKFEIATMDYGSVEVIQEGNNNDATLDILGEGSPSSLYKVEQAGGATVAISQSAFYMPMKSVGE